MKNKSPLGGQRERYGDCDVYILRQESHYVGVMGLVVQGLIKLFLD